MNLIKKGIGALLLAGLIVSSCSDDDVPFVSSTSIVLSSFEVTPSGDGTLITVTPLSVGVDSYLVDFGHNGSTATISEQNGSATYDYPNEIEEVTYTISVTAQAEGQTDVTKSENVTVIHVPATVETTPASPDGNDSDVFAIFSNGMDFDGGLLGWEHGLDQAADVIANIIPVDLNDIIQISRLGAEAGVVELDEEVVVSEAFASPANDNLVGIGATDIHIDVHSVFSEGIDKLKITLVNSDNGDEYVKDGIDLTDEEWTSLNYNLATDFSAPVMRIDEVKFELGTGGTANDHATISVDNIILTKDASSTILNGGFDLSTAQWKFATFTDGTTTPFGSSSDGSWTNYDGTDNGSKTRGAKWTSSQSGGPLLNSGSRYAYQALTLAPNTNYILEYEYAIKDDTADDPIGGRRIVGLALDGHYMDGANAIADIDSNLGNHVGTIAEGKFSNSVGTLVQIPFTSNDSGEVSVLFYAVTPKDGWIDNVKVYAN